MAVVYIGRRERENRVNLPANDAAQMGQLLHNQIQPTQLSLASLRGR